MLVRKSELRASKAMQQRVLALPNIEIHWDTETVEVLGDHVVNGVKIRNLKSGEEKVLDVQGFFVAIGHTPNTEVFKGQLNMDETGYIITEPGSTCTNVKGVFAAGDVQDNVYRQAVTAAGSGCMAALDAERFIVARETHTEED
jgi:thioredoxin reductase (NADPH)